MDLEAFRLGKKKKSDISYKIDSISLGQPLSRIRPGGGKEISEGDELMEAGID
jgi:hypothetical protein